ncbi:hypothetical protein Patl1_35662 [Pistacia atlantica]|nr:hypothetical protein Patl1_35662 [Pistacia atlantica]
MFNIEENERVPVDEVVEQESEEEGRERGVKVRDHGSWPLFAEVLRWWWRLPCVSSRVGSLQAIAFVLFRFDLLKFSEIIFTPFTKTHLKYIIHLSAPAVSQTFIGIIASSPIPASTIHRLRSDLHVQVCEDEADLHVQACEDEANTVLPSRPPSYP